jgi:hypothetical protein
MASSIALLLNTIATKCYYQLHGTALAFGFLITAAARSKTWTVFGRSNTGVVGSNPARGISACIYLFCICGILYVGIDLATDWSPIPGVLPTVYRIKELKKRRRPNKELQNHSNNVSVLHHGRKWMWTLIHAFLAPVASQNLRILNSMALMCFPLQKFLWSPFCFYRCL